MTTVGPDEVRRWGIEHGFTVGRRGRMPRRIWETYNLFHQAEGKRYVPGSREAMHRSIVANTSSSQVERLKGKQRKHERDLIALRLALQGLAGQVGELKSLPAEVGALQSLAAELRALQEDFAILKRDLGADY